MREIEFLPEWYHKTHRKRRIVVFQAWLLALLIVGLGIWIALVHRNVRDRRTMLGSLQRQLDQTYREQQILAEQLKLRQELQAREKLVASLGFPVDMTRLLQTLDSLMPKEMSLVELKFETEEQWRQVTSVAALRAAGGERERQLDRRLKVKILGVAPSDVDLANFLGGLDDVGFFEQIAVSYARDKIESGHVLREFEVTFSMSLNQPAGG